MKHLKRDHVILKTRADARNFIRGVVENAVNNAQLSAAIDEEEKAEKVSKDFDDDAAAEDEAEEKDEKEDLKKDNVTLSSIIDQLNTIRAGKSFKHDDIYAEIKEYFEDLTDEERLSLYAFLKGIGQIASGSTEGKDAVEPEDADPSLITKSVGSGKDEKKLTGIDKPKPSASVRATTHGGGKKKSGELEDRTPPLPIRPKNR